MNNAYISLGSNLGDRKDSLKKAHKYISEFADIVSKSQFYETAPIGGIIQSDFLNQVIHIQTLLDACDLMNKLLATESRMGRIRENKWGPRLIDLDIICFNDLRFENDMLNLPHPEFHKRRFVLEPLNEIASDLQILGMSVREYLLLCEDSSEVSVYKGA